MRRITTGLATMSMTVVVGTLVVASTAGTVNAAATPDVPATSHSSVSRGGTPHAETSRAKPKKVKTWKTWHCGKLKSPKLYQCRRLIRYDYCGTSRPMRLVQRTKMSGHMFTDWVAPPPFGGPPVQADHTWRASKKVKNRNMYVGQVSAYFTVRTPKKPQAKPYVKCDSP